MHHYEPQFDDPTRVADFGHFPHERVKPLKITGDDLAGSLLLGREPASAPFREWVPLVFEGWNYAPIDLAASIAHLKAWLTSSDDRYVGDAMDILNDIAFEKYGGGDD